MVRALGAGAVVAVVAALGLPAAGRADCGGAQVAAPAHTVRGQLPPLALGDSTMLLSLPGLSARGYEVNAQGCRQFFQAVDLLATLKASHDLPRMVVIALGANGPITSANIAGALKILGLHRLLVLVTPRQLGGSAGTNATLERVAARAHPSRILLFDWVADSDGHSSWFQPDKLHLTLAGVHAFNALLSRALPCAYVTAG